MRYSVSALKLGETAVGGLAEKHPPKSRLVETSFGKMLFIVSDKPLKPKHKEIPVVTLDVLGEAEAEFTLAIGDFKAEEIARFYTDPYLTETLSEKNLLKKGATVFLSDGKRIDTPKNLPNLVEEIKAGGRL
ncbi:MAG TPA: hypothetical protein ENN13_00705, partial [Candidatus Altiarchaeales archaeon]|nr:hypothetical protein [Candidatus Altiarchaeales archaeon]